jgi:hypothetical protein
VSRLKSSWLSNFVFPFHALRPSLSRVLPSGPHRSLRHHELPQSYLVEPIPRVHHHPLLRGAFHLRQRIHIKGQHMIRSGPTSTCGFLVEQLPNVGHQILQVQNVSRKHVVRIFMARHALKFLCSRGTDADPQEILQMTADVVCCSSPNELVQSCASCQSREVC